MAIKGEIVQWGCLACNSRYTGLVESPEGSVMMEYIDGRMLKGTNRFKVCPIGFLFVDEWKEV